MAAGRSVRGAGLALATRRDLSPDLGRLDRQRLDLWLWHARFRRARAECARLVSDGAVRINRRPTDKPHALVGPGDVLTIALGTADERPDGRLGGQVRVVRIAALADRRGSASVARSLYEELGAG